MLQNKKMTVQVRVQMTDHLIKNQIVSECDGLVCQTFWARGRHTQAEKPYSTDCDYVMTFYSFRNLITLDHGLVWFVCWILQILSDMSPTWINYRYPDLDTDRYRSVTVYKITSRESWSKAFRLTTCLAVELSPKKHKFQLHKMQNES